VGVRRLPPDVGRMCRMADEAYGVSSGLVCTGEGARGRPEEARPGRQRDGERRRPARRPARPSARSCRDGVSWVRGGATRRSLRWRPDRSDRKDSPSKTDAGDDDKKGRGRESPPTNAPERGVRVTVWGEQLESAGDAAGGRRGRSRHQQAKWQSGPTGRRISRAGAKQSGPPAREKGVIFCVIRRLESVILRGEKCDSNVLCPFPPAKRCDLADC